MSATILPFDEWREVLREAKQPEPNAMVIAAAENARRVEALAQRNRDALEELAEVELPCDVER